MHALVRVIIFSSVAFIVLFVFSKLLGKKQISQLDFVDYVIGISIGSIAAEMPFDNSIPFYQYIVAMAVFFLFSLLVSLLGRKGPLMKKLLKGHPIVIIYEGKILYKNLKKSLLDVNDLLCLTRAQGYFDLNQIYYAVFETNGGISIMPVAEERPAVAKDLPIPLAPVQLPNYLVVDGHISYSGLNEIGRDKAWLLKKLDMQEEKELKGLLLASYDADADTVVTHLKEE